MSRSNQAIEHFLNTIYVRLYNARHTPQILDALARVHYTAARLDEGLTLHERARLKHHQQMEEYGEQYAATDALYQAQENLNKNYRFHRKYAKKVFKNDRDRYNNLRLHERIPHHTRFDRWFSQAFAFYQNFSNDTTALATFQTATGIPPTDITEGFSRIRHIERLNTNQEQEKGEAQIATAERDALLDQLEDYVDYFNIAADRALADNQRLESLLLGPIPHTSTTPTP